MDRKLRAVLRRAAGLVRAGVAGDPWVQLHGRLRDPMVVVHPWGDAQSWLVPVTSGDRMVGYVQLNPDLEFMRYVSFQRVRGSLDDTPLAADWLEIERIRERAAAFARPDEILDEPVLTYDQYPDRLAWRVMARSKDGATREIMVAGNTAYEPVRSGDVIGGPGNPGAH
jgi:hypothetical protein